MRWLKQQGDLDQFFAGVAKAEQPVLATDYDGTLAPFVFERMKAVPYDDVLRVLREIVDRTRTRLVILTGRTVEGQREVMGLDRDVEVWGTHGWERRTAAGEYKTWPLEEACAEGLEEVAAWAREQDLAHQLETKPASAAIHWRSAGGSDRKRIAEAAEKKLKTIAEKSGLELHRFDGGLELRTPGRDKGLAVRTLLEEVGDKTPFAYLGDDLTDEDAFRELEGRGLSVLVRGEFRETGADLWLRPPRELVRFLERWRDAAQV